MDESDAEKPQQDVAEEIREKAAANRFKRAQKAVKNVDFYWGSLVDDQIEQILTVQGHCLLADAPRSRKLSLRFWLHHRTAGGFEKVEVKHAASDFLLAHSKEKMMKWVTRMKLHLLKRPIFFPGKNIVEERETTAEIKSVFEMGEMNKAVVQLAERVTVAAVQVRVRLDENRRERMAETLLRYLEMGNLNIQRLWGCSVLGEDFSILLEDVTQSLSRMLSTGDRTRLSAWSKGLHSALLYLEQSDFVHYRLSLDSCFLSTTLQLKLAVYCLGEELIHPAIQRKNVDTCRWIPWECLDGAYTLKSAVWTFGTILWSMYHGGAIPYENQLEQDVRSVSFRRAYELYTLEALFPSNVEELVGNCWQDQENRPSLFRLKSLVEQL